jgi:hypothetical protein
MKIVFKFNTIGGAERVEMTLKEALGTELGRNVMAFALDRACTGGVCHSHSTGRVEVEILEREAMTPEDRQLLMYGETVEEMHEAAGKRNMGTPNAMLMYAMSIMSDAQELLARGRSAAEVNQLLNKAKHFTDRARQELPR